MNNNNFLAFGVRGSAVMSPINERRVAGFESAESRRFFQVFLAAKKYLPVAASDIEYRKDTHSARSGKEQGMTG